MFSSEITDTDKFMTMPSSSRELYFQLGMHGDDEGFIGNPRQIMRGTGAAEGDMTNLIERGFVYSFSSGVIVILDWEINNTLRADRRKPTIYQSELNELKRLPNKRYALRQPDDNQVATNRPPSIVQSSLVKCSVVESSVNDNQLLIDDSLYQNSLDLTLFQKQEINLFINEDGLSIDVVIKAIEKTGKVSKPSFNYLKSVLNGFVKDGVVTLDDLRRNEANFRGTNNKSRNNARDESYYKSGPLD